MIQGIQPATMLAPQKARQIPKRDISIEDFLKIEDEDLKKYLYMNANVVNERTYVDRIDNDEKLSYYQITKSIKVSVHGKFYKRCTLKQWIYYNKKTKKVRVSPKYNAIYDIFLEEYFDGIDVIRRCIPRLTPTLCKKIIEGKINTLEDIAKYHRSYTVRNKNLSLAGVCKFMLTSSIWELACVKDPENITPELIKILTEDYQVANIISARLFKFNVLEIPKIKEIYNEWAEKQSKKLNTFPRSRDENNGDFDIKVSM